MNRKKLFIALGAVVLIVILLVVFTPLVYFVKSAWISFKYPALSNYDLLEANRHSTQIHRENGPISILVVNNKKISYVNYTDEAEIYAAIKSGVKSTGESLCGDRKPNIISTGWSHSLEPSVSTVVDCGSYYWKTVSGGMLPSSILYGPFDK